ncbi:MAG TPA: acyl carrier protein [Planctomycetota bacterium]|nr:acyl carrier protein [Planctomycetota bacterium]HUW35332.1 acyl carrier protein [Planctomycetota bacterium]
MTVEDAVADKVIDIVCNQMGKPKDKIGLETSFVNDLGADSLDVAELLMEFEEKFEITIPTEEAEKITTIGDAVKYIKEHA